MMNLQDDVITYLLRMVVVCRQRSIRRKICPRDQSLLQTRKSNLSQPLQYTLRQSLVLTRNTRKVNKSHTNNL